MKIFLIITTVICIIVLFGVYMQDKSKLSVAESIEQVVLSDYKNIEYTIEGEKISLINGISETSVLYSDARIFTQYFGSEIKKDLNGDGREDIVFILTQKIGGTGVFFYVVAALNTENGYVGSKALYLGDRIAPQTAETGSGRIVIINYVDRAQGEPFSTPPSIGKSLYLILDLETMQFEEVDYLI